MLESFRRASKSWIVKVLFALLILSFGVWGIEDIFRNFGQENAVARIGDREISRTEFASELRREIERMRNVLGNQIDIDQARQMGVFDRVLDRLVARALLMEAAREVGVAVSDDLVRRAITAEPAFQADGQFSRARFETFLQSSGYTEGRFVEQLRQDIARSQVVQPVLASGTAPKPLVNALYKYRNEQRSGAVVTISREAVGPIGTPDEAALKAVHEANPAQFSRPETRTFTLAHLSPDILAKEIKISEDRLREAYDNRIDQFRTPERRHLRQILLLDEAAAKKAAEILKTGRPFDDVAKETAQMTPEQTDLGTVVREELPPELAETAFTLPAGATSDPIRSPLGWHIVKVETVQAGSTKEFEQARDELAKELAHEEALDHLYELANKLEDELAGGATLNEAAQRIGAQVRSVGPATAEGKTPDGKPVDAPAIEDLFETVFRTPEGQDSSLVETRDDGYYMVHVDKVTPSSLRPLDEVRDAVAKLWEAQQRDQAALKMAEDMAARIREGAKLEALAAERKLPVTELDALTRIGPPPGGLPAALTGKLFATAQGEPFTLPADKGGAVIGVTRKITEADPAANQPAVTALSRAVDQSIGSSLLDAYGEALRNEIGVTVNRALMEQSF